MLSIESGYGVQGKQGTLVLKETEENWNQTWSWNIKSETQFLNYGASIKNYINT